MIDRGFLFRRLARFFPACFPHVACGGIQIANKDQLASFSEVFLNPHYWRLFDLLAEPPKIIVDLGGNCGFFPVLCEIAVRSKYGHSDTKYHIFEAVEAMTQNIAFAAQVAKIEERISIVHGAVGKQEGTATFSSGRKSYLDSSAVYEGESRRFREQIDYINIGNYVKEHNIDHIDVLKVDIEGSEYDLIENFPQVFQKASLVFLELHDLRGENEKCKAKGFFANSGFELIQPAICSGPHELLVLRRKKS